MIQVTYTSDVLSAVEKELGNLKDKARPVAKKAVNATAKDARKLLAKRAQSTYAIKQGGFNRNAKIKSATNSTLTATIRITGKANELKSFRVSPASYSTGAARPAFIRAKVVKKNSYKKLEKGGIKSFIVKFASGHVAAAQRQGKSRYPIKVLYSLSNPGMIGSKRVYGEIKPEIAEQLMSEIRKYVSKELAKGGGV